MDANWLRNIRGTLFIIAMLMLIIQTVNLGYLNWFIEKSPRHERTEADEEDDDPGASKAAEITYENRDISEMNYFCFSGLLLVIWGVIISKRMNALLGLPLMIAGFCELIGYSGVHIRYPNTDYNRFMTLKFIYSCSSLLLLLGAAYMLNIIKLNKTMTEKMMSKPY